MTLDQTIALTQSIASAAQAHLKALEGLRNAQAVPSGLDGKPWIRAYCDTASAEEKAQATASALRSACSELFQLG